MIKKKPATLPFVSEETWKKLRLREKAFLHLLFSRKFSETEIKEKLYFEERSSFWRFKKNVTGKIKEDVAKYNEKIKKT